MYVCVWGPLGHPTVGLVVVGWAEEPALKELHNKTQPAHLSAQYQPPPKPLSINNWKPVGGC